MDFEGFEPAPEMRAFLNVGFPWDQSTGVYVPGKDGEEIVNGGLMPFTGFAGGGNMYKSTMSHWLHLSVLAHYPEVKGMVYDTEPPSCSYKRFKQLMETIDKDFTLEHLKTRLLLTDITKMLGGAWFAQMQKFRDQKVANRKKMMLKTPMLLDNGTQLEELVPHVAEVDSLSMMSLDATMKLLEENELGDSGANIEAMRSQGAKTQMLMQIPNMSTDANIFFIMTAHTGKTYQLDARTPQAKQMTFLKQDVKLKNVPEKFTFLPNNLYHSVGCTTLINKTTKAPEYPRSPEDDMKGDTDLMLITVINLRGKGGATGVPMELIVSQSEGYREDLTALRYLKSNEGFGLGGNDKNYYVEFLPAVKLSRTTVRGKCLDDYKLRRALQLCGELCQMHNYWHDNRRAILLKPDEIFAKINALGFDWNELLETRGYWVFDGNKDPRNFLSTKDLLRMAHGTYVPKWYKKPLTPLTVPTGGKELLAMMPGA